MSEVLTHPLVLCVVVAFVAALYSSVGHGGASGYLAVMAILSFPSHVMKPGALILNLLVSGIGAINFWRAGHLRLSLIWPFILTSIPFSYIGAKIHISPETYSLALAATLLFAGIRLSMATSVQSTNVNFSQRPLPSFPATTVIGAVIGFISGMVGVGGGIFLSPIFILMKWATPKETAAVSALFIWLNSAAGLAGHFESAVKFPPGLLLWIIAAGLGGILGSFFGAKRFSGTTLRRLLAVVLLVAAAKTLLVAFQ